MGYSVKILADSLGPNDVRLTTWELSYPRFVHAELMTHRLFSRNSASSRAIPVTKLLERVKSDPVFPKWWGKNQSGMQAERELSESERGHAIDCWLRARDKAVESAEELLALGVHKQLANRVLEPWMFITVLVTATEYANWFRLRCHPAAQPEIGWIAKEMSRQYEAIEPTRKTAGEWHLPLVSPEEEAECRDCGLDPVEISTGRCARVSYLTHDGRRDLSEDIGLCSRLSQNGHWSPFEHPAQATESLEWFGNFRGWKQFRSTVDPNFTWVGGRRV